eukprot:scaffold11045_cov138-Skeletonema_menzelii.AAC.1
MLNATNHHQRNCGRGLHLTKMNRHGFEVITKMSCNYCKKVYEIRNGPEPVNDPTAKKRRGPKTSQLNMTVTNAMHTSAIQIAQMGQFCMEVGCVAPSETGLHGMMSKRKEAIEEVAEEILRENRREHVRTIKDLNPNHTIKHKDADGKIHNICHGAVSADGAGDKRAYSHIITGSQHCTVVFSIITGRALAIKHDQVSCAKCSHRLNKLLLEDNKRIEDITEDDLKHEGKCYINSKHGPAVAEEHALEWLAEYLLIDPQTKKLRNDDEAILADLFVADGDTKGATRFINKQASIITEFDGIALYLPDIGHFIKCISNGFFNLAGKDNTLKGAALLEASRIKAISTDITKILKEYGKQMKCIEDECGDNTSLLEGKLNVAREAAMKRINAIIPHHCNDHSSCGRADCYVIKRQRHYINLHNATHPQSGLTEEAIIEKHQTDIAIDHKDNGRFNGKHMSMGKKGQAKVQAVISSRLDGKNIDRVARAKSSNRCENMFHVLAKYSHGKRLNQSRTDTWKVNGLYVAATINNNKHAIENKIRERTGVKTSPTLREEACRKHYKRKEYHKEMSQSEKVIQQRKKRKIASTSKAVKNMNAPARHKPDKLSPKDDCKSNKENKAAEETSLRPYTLSLPRRHCCCCLCRV